MGANRKNWGLTGRNWGLQKKNWGITRASFLRNLVENNKNKKNKHKKKRRGNTEFLNISNITRPWLRTAPLLPPSTAHTVCHCLFADSRKVQPSSREHDNRSVVFRTALRQYQLIIYRNKKSDQMSTGTLYCWDPSRISGARYLVGNQTLVVVLRKCISSR